MNISFENGFFISLPVASFIAIMTLLLKVDIKTILSKTTKQKIITTIVILLSIVTPILIDWLFPWDYLITPIVIQAIMSFFLIEFIINFYFKSFYQNNQSKFRGVSIFIILGINILVFSATFLSDYLRNSTLKSQSPDFRLTVYEYDDDSEKKIVPYVYLTLDLGNNIKKTEMTTKHGYAEFSGINRVKYPKATWSVKCCNRDCKSVGDTTIIFNKDDNQLFIK